MKSRVLCVVLLSFCALLGLTAAQPKAKPKSAPKKEEDYSKVEVRGTIGGSGELEDIRWYPLAEALVLDLAFVTRHVLAQLDCWRALDPATRAARRSVPVLRERTWSGG